MKKMIFHERPLGFHQNHRKALLKTITTDEDNASDNNVVDGNRQDFLHQALGHRALALTVFSFLTYILDFFFDISLAATYFLSGQYWYFGLTSIFVLIPSIIITFLSLWWYISDSRDPECPKPTLIQWIIRAIFLILQLAPILRQIDALRFALKAREFYHTDRKMAKRYLLYMMFESTDGSMLRMFEAFMESAPQLVLQITIIFLEFPNGNLNIMTVISVINSLGWLSWSLATYINKLRHSLPNKRKLSSSATGVLGLWRFFMIGSRVLTLALFASRFPEFVAAICTVHWLIWFIWLRRIKTNFSNHHYEEIIYNAIMAIMYIFCFINPLESPAKFRYSAFYLMMFLENVLMLTCWFLTEMDRPGTSWPDLHRIYLLILCLAGFTLGLLTMAIFMLFFHPTINVFLQQSGPTSEVIQYSPDDEQNTANNTVQIHAIWTTKVPWITNDNGPKTAV